ncbi:MAG: hypothetical protein RBR78_02235 [Flavobacteriaceae bacterium]|jgi:hypothetical protein|nr:hypothetical protein [Flavobacteriaceae bacterium]
MKLIITFFYRGLIFFGVLFYSSFIFAQHTHDFSCGIEEAEINIDVSSYPQGLYSITLITNGQISDTTTLIKQ